jgi:gliding motility-associated-like protein
MTRAYKLILIFCLAMVSAGMATHNRAGEITYKRIQPFTKVVGGVTVPVYTYSITVIKYTADGPSIADRCVDTIFFGDGDRGIAPRNNGANGSCCPDFNGSKVPCGSIIINDPGYKVKQNIYTIIHTYPGAGTYIIRTFDPNRNADVHNIPNSINLPFYIESKLIIDNFTGANSSPVFAFPPIDKACQGVCFEHNPGAFDPDGDSLSYEITTSRGVDGETVLGYFFPETGANGTFGINATSGLLRWCSPQITAEYNIAFIVKEWRKNTSGDYKMIGYVLRDMQVIVNTCPKNLPPQIDPLPDLCVEAGQQVKVELTVRDPNHMSNVTISGGGGAFAATPPVATINPTTGTTFTNTGSNFKVNFAWQTTCDHVRSQPYNTTFKAQDNGPDVKLVSFQSFNIKVVPPSVKGVSAVPVGSTIRLTWTPTTCNPSGNKLLSYRVYRKGDCSPYTPDPCSTGLDATSGYTLVGTTMPSESAFTDSNNGDGLVVGQSYGYIIVAEYADGTQTFGSTQVCTQLKRDVPVLTNVDVLSTSLTTGSVQVRWARPLTTPGNLDLSVFTGPYQYVLKHRSSESSSFVTVFTTSNTVFSALDESFLHTGLNTDSAFHEYIIDFISGTLTVGSSQKASSVFLKASPSDRKIDLEWSAKTPWSNYNYIIHRRDPGAATFTTIGTTTLSNYADTKAVVNGSTYCYYVTSYGAYSDSTIPKPLINNSQIACATAKDLTPPVTPTLNIDASCPDGKVEVSWTDISPYSDDVKAYELFFKPTISDLYGQVATINANQTLVFHYDGNSISGCYAIRATDINNNTGELSADFCIDNCPEFELPNVFSPNGDSINDYYKAIKVRQIKEIELTITDRWGNPVYKTRDPYFHWNGISQYSKNPVSEGTFFFVCEVFEPRISGVSRRTITGYIQVVR